MTKAIRVDEKVHRQVRKIAEANFRGLGDQIAYWVAMDCPHPIEQRQEKVAHVVGSQETVRFFYCSQCKRHVFHETPIPVSDDQPSPTEEKKRGASVRAVAVPA